MILSQRQRSKATILAVLVLLFLLVLASRMTRLSTLEMDVDEAWSAWQILGNPAQILAWTPYDWPPLSYLAMGTWRSLTGLNPIILRLLPLYIFLLGLACLFRAGKRLFGDRAALLAVAVCAALAMSIHLSTLLRGYGFVLALMPLALWLTLRYFTRPTWRRALPLAIVLAVMFYIHVSATFAIMTLVLFALIFYGGWRGLLPLIIAGVIVAPELLSKMELAGSRASHILSSYLATPFDKLSKSYLDFGGYAFWLWLLLFVVAGILIVWRSGLSRKAIALLLWALMPLPLFFTAIIGSNDSRQEGWVMIGIALWIGWGLSNVPRRLQSSVTVVALAVFSVLMFEPIPINRYVLSQTPVAQNFAALAKQIRWGDVVVIDPNVTSVPPEEWYFYAHAYFPNGLQVVSSPDGYRRVWYVTKEGQHDPSTDQAVTHNRIAENFFGPPSYLFRLYEAPPDITGIPFANGLRFHGIDLLEPDDYTLLSLPFVRHEGESFHVRLWWTVDHVIDRDYSVSVRLSKNKDGALIVQDDSAPTVMDKPPQTSQWQPGQYYVEDRVLTFPNPSDSTQYMLALTVYQWWDNVRISAPGMDDQNLLHLGTITVTSW